jgi:putative flippase GtrA
VALKSAAASAVHYLRQNAVVMRFVAAGVLNTLFGLAVFPLLMWAFKGMAIHYLVVLIIAQVISVFFSFLTSKFLVFRTSGNYLSEFGKFSMFHVLYFAANLVALPVLVEVFGVPPVWGQFGFAIAVIISSYFWQSRITFNRRSP